MSFQPDSDPNFKAYLKVRNQLYGNLADNFELAFIQYLCSQATATGTINAAMISNAITQGGQSVARMAPTFSFNPDSDVNFQAYLAQRNKLSADLAAEYGDAFIRYLCAQATATGTINATMINTAITHARATASKKSPTF